MFSDQITVTCLMMMMMMRWLIPSFTSLWSFLPSPATQKRWEKLFPSPPKLGLTPSGQSPACCDLADVSPLTSAAAPGCWGADSHSGLQILPEHWQQLQREQGGVRGAQVLHKHVLTVLNLRFFVFQRYGKTKPFLYFHMEIVLLLRSALKNLFWGSSPSRICWSSVEYSSIWPLRHLQQLPLKINLFSTQASSGDPEVLQGAQTPQWPLRAASLK